mmetsp:Transcript_109769/g.321368  ORF Transcript_109769/g.321368 Transcript_109769/m.321368 type:complete len:264 (+) Transcript_109769:64-855(+)
MIWRAMAFVAFGSRLGSAASGHVRGSIHRYLLPEALTLEDVCGSNVTSACESSAHQGDLCKDHPAFCRGNLGRDRCHMPQLPSRSDQQKFEAWQEACRGQGIRFREANSSAGELARLVPSQLTLDTCKVCAMAQNASSCLHNGQVPDPEACSDRGGGCFCVWASGVAVSGDGHIVDGHHRWAAVRLLVDSQMLPASTPAVLEEYNTSVDNLLKLSFSLPDLVWRDCSSSASVGPSVSLRVILICTFVCMHARRLFGAPLSSHG